MALELLLSHRHKNSSVSVVGFVLIALVLGMIPCMLFAISNGEPIRPFLWPIIICSIIAAVIMLLFRLPDIVRPVDGLVMVAVMWIVAITVGSVPFTLAGMDPIDSIFESTSGITTTGSTIMDDIDSWPSGILLWRSVMQWIGGIAIIIIFMLLMPMIGFGGRELFGNETSGSGATNFSIKLRDAAKQFIIIYLMLTAILIVILLILGMNFYEGLCLALSTISTGGFMCKGDSVISYRSLVKIVVMIFMFLGGTNFYLHFKAVYRKNSGGYVRNEEFRFMFLINVLFIALAFFIVTAGNEMFSDEGLHEIIDVAFNVVSASTTTGFVASNYDNWAPTAVMVLFIAMIIGGSTGSTSGGLKVGRLLVALKYAFNGLKEMLHPKAFYDLRLNRSSVDTSTISGSITICILFFFTIIVGTGVLMLVGIDFQSSITTIVANLTTFGPATGPYGAIGSYQDVEWYTKLFLCVIMWLGRLEILTGLILLTPGFWKEYVMSRRMKHGKPLVTKFRR
ncbi:MAG: TrkH family potassium uptake protein [Candidatus Methanomethylophilaceae archaeon]|nr:TrkH family potassium uptake protein [Candidatus Methanomethylophilaceae archaeon]